MSTSGSRPMEPATAPAGDPQADGRGLGAADQVRTVVAHGRRLRVSVRHGDGTRPALLLCNGIGSSLELLQPFVDALDSGLEVIRFDLPGIGGSPPPVVPYHMSTLPALIGGMLTALGHDDPVDVLGMSWGGGLAQQLAFQCRRRVRKLVLVATATGSLMVPARPNVLWKMLTPRRHRDPEYARRIAGEIYGGSMRTEPSVAARLLHASRRVGPQRGYYYQLLAGLGWSSLPGLPLLRQPTLILAGDDDPLIPLVNARIMHALLPHSELHVYDGGHLGLLTQADHFAGVVQRFLHRP